MKMTLDCYFILQILEFRDIKSNYTISPIIKFRSFVKNSVILFHFVCYNNDVSLVYTFNCSILNKLRNRIDEWSHSDAKLNNKG